MSYHIHCPTDVAVLVLGIQREDGLIVVPSDPGPIPGIRLKVNPSLPINPQLLDALSKRTMIPSSKIHIWQEFQDQVTLENGLTATVYAARTTDMIEEIPVDALPLPVLMRAMPANRNRVAYMKVLQVFSGALEEQTKAIELDELKRHLEGLEK